MFWGAVSCRVQFVVQRQRSSTDLEEELTHCQFRPLTPLSHLPLTHYPLLTYHVQYLGPHHPLTVSVSSFYGCMEVANVLSCSFLIC